MSELTIDYNEAAKDISCMRCGQDTRSIYFEKEEEFRCGKCDDAIMTTEQYRELFQTTADEISKELRKLFIREGETILNRDVLREVTKTRPGGGLCPNCDVRLIGKANYCGKCGQKVGWKVYE